MSTNDFKAFSTGGGANVLTQAQYVALTTLISNGFQTGPANSQQFNKVWRQSSIMAAVLGALIGDVIGQNAVDDGTTGTLESNLLAAIMRAGYVDDSGAVNAYVATLVPAVLAYYDGLRVSFSTANANTSTTPTLNVNGLGAVTITGVNGSALSIGQIPANSIIGLTYNSTGPRFELRNSSSGSASQTFSGAAATAAAHFVRSDQITTDPAVYPTYTKPTAWTPNQGAGLTVVGAFGSSGTYIKNGKHVIAVGQVSGATSVACAAASAICSNLPATAAARSLNGNAAIASMLTSHSIFTVESSTNLFSCEAIGTTGIIYFTISYIEA